MHFEVQTSGEVRVLFYTLDEEHKYQEPFDFMSSARRHYEDTIVRFLEKALRSASGTAERVARYQLNERLRNLHT
jgi:hypothetical protein